MDEEILKMFENGVSAEDIFEQMENLVPTERCMECVHRHNANLGGANIFCSCMDGEHDYAIVAKYNASDCKHFKKKTEESDRLEKMAIEMLISKMR